MKVEDGGCKHGGFDAVGGLFTEDAAGRFTGIAIGFVVDSQRIKEVLNFCRTIQPFKQGSFRRGEIFENWFHGSNHTVEPVDF